MYVSAIKYAMIYALLLNVAEVFSLILCNWCGVPCGPAHVNYFTLKLHILYTHNLNYGDHTFPLVFAPIA